jgi:hypothetical protein
VDVIGIHLDYDDTPGGIYYEVKLLCNDEDLAGVPIALRAQRSTPDDTVVDDDSSDQA